MLSLGSALGVAALGQGGFSLASLFRNGENGFVFSPALAAYLFQDASATTSVAVDTDPVARFNDQSGKGNNAVQSTTTKRPTWKANSGKPYLLADGTDDLLVSTFIPTTACTLACVVNLSFTGVNRVMIGGGNSTGNKRCFVAVTAAGLASVGWGIETVGTNSFGASLIGTDHVLVLTGDATTRDLWIDGVLVDSRSPGGTGPDGTGGGVAICAYNNNGIDSSPMGGRFYAGFAVNRRLTANEIIGSTSILRSTYQ